MNAKKGTRFHISYQSAVIHSDFEKPKYGTDVSSKKMDELDFRATRYGMGLKRKNKKFLTFVDLGAGLAIQSVRMALNGYQSYAYDLSAAPQTIASVARVYQVGRVTFVTGDLSSMSSSAFPKSIDILYGQRFIHYLRFKDAVNLLSNLNKRMKRGAHLFLSAAGFDTEIAADHPDREKGVAERFAPIISETARLHCVTAPLCIYRLEDLELLTGLSGFDTVDCWLTEFGNVQGVFSKK